MTKFKNSITLILLISFFLIFTCTTDNSITGSSDKNLGKTTSIVDINHDDKEKTDFDKLIDRYFNVIGDRTDLNHICYFITAFAALIEANTGLDVNPFNEDDDDYLSKPYDFRDNYLTKSEKGEVYTACYYFLSKYGIENNLVNKYYKEHIELLKTSTAVAYNLQYGSNAGQILVNKKFSDDLTDMLKVYRNSSNYKDIEPVLEYLEADLEKYSNKSKYEISIDFK